LDPSHNSATSQNPPAARHCAVLFASAGQALFRPSHASATSQTPAEARHSAVLLASAGHALLTPSQASATSQMPPDARHSDVSFASAGQVSLEPSHTSATSQTPPEARHSAVLWHPPPAGVAGSIAHFRQVARAGRGAAGGRALGIRRTVVADAVARLCEVAGADRGAALGRALAVRGQALFVPSQMSATSQTPAEPRHCAVLLPSAGHVLLVPVQLSATSQMPPEARHSVLAEATTSAGQVSLTAVAHFRDIADADRARHVDVLFASAGQGCSRRRTTPRGRRHRRGAALGGLFASPGQALLEPVQVSCGSQTPPEPRHTVLLEAKLSAGQVLLLPGQTSATSQMPPPSRAGRRALAVHRAGRA
jgi:hypothetical protein